MGDGGDQPSRNAQSFPFHQKALRLAEFRGPLAHLHFEIGIAGLELPERAVKTLLKNQKDGETEA